MLPTWIEILDLVAVVAALVIAFKIGQFWERGQWLGSERRWQQFPGWKRTDADHH